MYLPYSEELNIQYLNRLFDNTSECYKFFWFKAILTKLNESRTRFSFEELVDEMIASAWYMVSEYHLNLGPNDNLEKVVKLIHSKEHFKPSEKKAEILNYLAECKDNEVNRIKKTLILNVPYRLQAPFYVDIDLNKKWNGSKIILTNEINRQSRLMYYFGEYKSLHTEVIMQDDWVRYIQKNQGIIEGWLQYNMITYLQRRNPSVPGIADKLYPPKERNLDKVKKLWRMIIELHPTREIYGNVDLSVQNISIDHFVPWSYVAHDELWNLHPTTRAINSSKSNRLPDWNTYFALFSNQEYLLYRAIWEYDKIHDEFIRCSKEHLNNSDFKHRLYREGLNFEDFNGQLEDIIRPVYDSAKNCGFLNWTFQND